ncbi:hypothetical protein AAGS40_23160 [Paraburkholderia sp. PREW-6R]|uniref:hypothetical protein n=1 Tax=Paraburkholderia sp. PREW-6R TaxID=3141544 RepID=UPI0031F54AB1
MNYTTVTNPVYGSADGSCIACMVQFDGFAEPVQFLAVRDDPVQHGAEIFADLAAGKYGPVGAYVAPALTPEQQYAAAISAGLSVRSSSVPALEGTYGVSAEDVSNIAAEAQFISTYSEFTNGQSSFAWPDAGGDLRTFTSTASFMAFAKGAAQYVSGCRQALNALRSGAEAVFPSNVVDLG